MNKILTIFSCALGVGAFFLLEGCAETPTQPAPKKIVHQVPPITVQLGQLHTGRYTLVTEAPTAEQSDLESQIIDIQIPARLNATLYDGFHYLLERSGLTLCQSQLPEVQSLYHLPLPAIHYHVGPMPLIAGIETLAGDTYQVEIDPVRRVVCFRLKDAYRHNPDQYYPARIVARKGVQK